jgi:tetratricopeptide (TPR) repeat protein
MSYQRVFVANLVVVLLAGCRGEPAPVSEAPKEVTSSSSDASKELCLADPGASARIDNELRSLQQGALRAPSTPEPWALVGSQWVRKARTSTDPGFYVNVEACAAASLAVEPEFVPALVLRGLALMNDHKFDEARALAGEILMRDPEDEIALGLLSDALLELGRVDDAARAAQRQMSVRPGMAAHARGSYLRWLKGDTETAKAFLRDALVNRDARDPEPAAWAFVETASIFWHQGDYEGADALYAEALKWLPAYPPALVGRGRNALAQGEPRKAIDFFESAYRTRPLPETAWLLSDAQEMLGNADAVLEAHQRVVRQGRRGDHLTLALFYATKNRDLDEALRLIEEERRVRRGIYVEDTYAWVLYRAGKIEEAARAIEPVLRLGTKDARLLYHAGAIRLAGGERTEGLRLVRQALSLNPKFDFTSAAEARKLSEASPVETASN